MKDRIVKIMEGENLSPAKFADKLQINRAVISHILNGRNNPSLDVVSKILSEMDNINPEWLINGTGSMYKSGMELAPPLRKENDLFSQNEIKPEQEPDKTKYRKDFEVESSEKENQRVEYKIIEPIKKPDKKITQIIIYYDDNTFEIFSQPLVKQ